MSAVPPPDFPSKDQLLDGLEFVQQLDDGVFVGADDEGRRWVLKQVDYAGERIAPGLEPNQEHPAFVHKFDSIGGASGKGTKRGQPKLAKLALVEGRSLQQLLASGPLDEADACAIVHELATAMHVAMQHNQSVGLPVPSKVMIDQRGQVRTLNVGPCSGVRDSLNVAPKQLRYLPPELDEAHGQYSPQELVYALGCLLVELLEGTLPQELSGNPLDEADRREVLKTLNVSNMGLRPLVDRMKASDPQQRFGTLAEAAEALKLRVGKTSKERLRLLVGSTGQAASLNKHWPWAPAVDAMMAVIILLGIGIGAHLLRDNELEQLAKERRIWNQVVALVSPDHGWWFERIPWYSPDLRNSVGVKIRADMIGADERLATFFTDAKFAQGEGSLQDFPFFDQLDGNTTIKPGIAAAVRAPSLFGANHDELAAARDKRRETLQQFLRDETRTKATDFHWNALVHQSMGRDEDLTLANHAYEKAILAYQRQRLFSASLPLLALCHADYGRLAISQRDHKKGVQQFEEAFGIYGELETPPLRFHIECLCNAANASRKLKNFVKAEGLLTKARELANSLSDPAEIAYANERSAWWAMDQLDTVAAVGFFDAAIAERSSDTELGKLQRFHNRQGKAMALRYQGRTDAAIDEFRKIIDILDKEVSAVRARPSNESDERRNALYLDTLLKRQQNTHQRMGDTLLYSAYDLTSARKHYRWAGRLAEHRYLAEGGDAGLLDHQSALLKLAMVSLCDGNPTDAIHKELDALHHVQLRETVQLIRSLISRDSDPDHDLDPVAALNTYKVGNRDQLDFLLFACRSLAKPSQAPEIVANLTRARNALGSGLSSTGQRLLLHYVRPRYEDAIRLVTEGAQKPPNSIAQWIVASRSQNPGLHPIVDDTVLFQVFEDDGIAVHVGELGQTKTYRLPGGWRDLHNNNAIEMSTELRKVIESGPRIAWRDQYQRALGNDGITEQHWAVAFPELVDAYEGREMFLK